MDFHEQQHGGVTAIQPQGRIAEEGGAELRDRLLELRSRNLGRLVVDLSEVPYIDGLGLEALLDVTEELGRMGQTLKLCGENEVVREVLELTDLASSFEHFDDVTSAVRSFL